MLGWEGGAWAGAGPETLRVSCQIYGARRRGEAYWLGLSLGKESGPGLGWVEPLEGVGHCSGRMSLLLVWTWVVRT